MDGFGFEVGNLSILFFASSHFTNPDYGGHVIETNVQKC